jgi:hypothetical protein
MSNSRPTVDETFEQCQVVAAGAIPEPSPNLQAFISAPTSVDTSVIRQALERRGITPYEIDDLVEAGASITKLLDDCLDRADLVVAVLGGGKAKDNVLFELGYAMALKKRILALVQPGEEPPLSEIPYLRAAADNREAIEFGLDQILNAPWPGRKTPKDQVRKTRPIGDRADGLLHTLKAVLGHPNEQALTEIVKEALCASGVESTSYSSEIMADNGRADFAIWSDDFEPWVGNPLVVEVRSRLARAADLDRSLDQLTTKLQNTHTAWGLLLFGVADFRIGAKAALHPRVFAMSIDEFLRSLKDTSLGEFLSHLRNLRVHGKGQDGRFLSVHHQENPQSGRRSENKRLKGQGV